MPARKTLQSCPTIIVFVFTFLFITSSEVKGQSTPFIDSLLEILENQDPDMASIDILNRIAMRYTEVDPVEGMKYARQAKNQALRRGSPIDLARANNAIASNWLVLLEVDSAMLYYHTALSIYQAEDDKKGMGEIAGNMGHAAYYSGRYDEALQYYFEALTNFEELGFEEGITNQHASLGNTYMVQEKYSEAFYHDSIALAGFAAMGDSNGYAMVLGNLANICTEMDEFEKGAAYFQQAADIYERANQPLGMGRNLINLAAMYVDQGKYLPALESARKGLTICSDNNLELCIYYCLSNIGYAYLQSYAYKDSAIHDRVLVPGEAKELLKSAIHYLEQAVTLTDKLESPENFEDTHRALSQAYKYNGQFEKALQHHEIFASIKDSLASVERAERIEHLTTEREIAVRDKQIELDKLRLKVKRNERIYFIIGLALLAGWLSLVYRNAKNQRKSNQQLGLLNTQISTTNLQLEDRNVQLTNTLEELKATQAQLIEVERQKENEILRRRISRDIHDDISSGLSKISWMTEVLRNKPDTAETTDQEMLGRIASYSRETVSKLGEIIWSTKPESDNFSGLASYSREFLSRYMEGLPIRYQVNFPEQSDNTAMNPELRRNLYLVLKESVHNAVKYSKATDLTISMHAKDGGYSLVVEDNGIGMDINDSSPNGNGFRNMQGRMRDVNGTMSVHSSPGKGTRLEFSGPVY